MPKIILFANTDWYLYNFRRSLAVRLRDDGWEVVLISPPGEYGVRLEALGFRWIPFEFSTKSTSPVQGITMICRLATLYRAERPQLVHHFTIKCVIYGSLAARLAGNIRVVNSVTGLGHIFTDSGIKTRLLRPVVRGLYRFALGGRSTRVIFQNEEDRDTFVNCSLVKPEETKLIRGSGVDCNRFVPSNALASDHKVRVLFASRMLQEKGVFELLTAMKILTEMQLPVRLLLAGDLYPENPSSLTQRDLDWLKRHTGVEYLGHIENMPALMATCDIVVLPSYREGTPRVLIEAAAMGIPIVATDIAGCRGLVQHGINGLLVPVRDSSSLADAIKQLIVNSEQRRQFGLAGRQIVLTEFDEKIVLEKTLGVYAAISLAG